MSRATGFITKNCIECGAEFKIFFYENKKIRETRNTCRICVRKRPNGGQFKIGNSAKAKNNKYSLIHKWVGRRKGTPQKCEVCGRDDSGTQYDWANKDHKYRKVLADYTRMCAKCHFDYDEKNNPRQTK